ncbi:HNH endonuclease [Ochrobactrum soli]|uniref:HNH endonuclease n=1 Tax=Ochrobactrum soli TaxID=2448455 RepID=A0A2P9HH87_9HYPH|nr:HNH endonuclease [[Ochrobactrum] soli]
MATRAPSVCGHCGKAHPSGERCVTALRLEKERKARFDQKRPTANQRGYNSEWAKARKQYLAAHPLCCRCGAPANVVDHIKPHKGNHALFWDRFNWQSLCTPCHSGPKQAAERRNTKFKGSAKLKKVDGLPLVTNTTGGGPELSTPARDRRGQALTKKFRISSRFNER